MGRQDATTWRQTFYEQVGLILRRKRIAASLSAREVGERCGCSQQQIVNYEGGAPVPLHFLISFAALVGCEVVVLIPKDCPIPLKRVATVEDA